MRNYKLLLTVNYNQSIHEQNILNIIHFIYVIICYESKNNTIYVLNFVLLYLKNYQCWFDLNISKVFFFINLIVVIVYAVYMLYIYKCNLYNI